jgi:hypothetical protein
MTTYGNSHDAESRARQTRDWNSHDMDLNDIFPSASPIEEVYPEDRSPQPFIAWKLEMWRREVMACSSAAGDPHSMEADIGRLVKKVGFIIGVEVVPRGPESEDGDGDDSPKESEARPPVPKSEFELKRKRFADEEARTARTAAFAQRRQRLMDEEARVARSAAFVQKRKRLDDVEGMIARRTRARSVAELASMTRAELLGEEDPIVQGPGHLSAPASVGRAEPDESSSWGHVSARGPAATRAAAKPAPTMFWRRVLPFRPRKPRPDSDPKSRSAPSQLAQSVYRALAKSFSGNNRGRRALSASGSDSSGDYPVLPLSFTQRRKIGCFMFFAVSAWGVS